MSDNEREIMIRLDHVGKEYRLGQIGSGTLQQDLQSWWAVRHGREDPNSIVGTSAAGRIGRFQALKDISLTVYKGERLGIIGANGAGKSTLLKLISRVTGPTAGSIDLYGRVTSMLEVGTGFHGEMTGRENIYLNGTILGMTEARIDGILEDIIDFSEVREFIDTPVKRYSSGMYVKLGFSVASHLQSEIVIMDEVLAVGDISFQKKCKDKMIASSLDEDRTILFVSHNMNTIREVCDRCIVLDRGEIIYDGDVEKAITFYRNHLMGPGRDGGDLYMLPRRNRNLTGLCRLCSVFAEKDTIRDGEPLRFSIRVRSEEELADVRFRLIVKDPAGGIIGMAYSGKTHLSEGDSVIEAVFDTDPLAPQGYICDMAVFSFEKDVQTRHDFLSHVLSFTIEPGRKYFGQVWKPRAWGHTRLKEFEIQERSRRS